MSEIRPLGLKDINSNAFFELLRDAAGRNDAALRGIIKNELPERSVIGITHDGEVVAFAASHQSPLQVTVDYIAVATGYRSTGLGHGLITSIRRRVPMLSVFAETDDDAVDFYRRLGVVDSPHRDPRWPGRQRYRCVVGPLKQELPGPGA